MPDDRLETGDFVPHSEGMPVGRMPVDADIMGRLHCEPDLVTGESFLFDIAEDPDDTNNLAGTELEQEYEKLMADALSEIGAPEEQFERIGLTKPKP